MTLHSIAKKIKEAMIGKAKNPMDRTVFHNLSLIAFFAWVGLGADGLSSSCYGPEEAFLALGQHVHLSLIVALAAAVTVFIISGSYAQIIELFPSGGGGYLVASRLLSPTWGMVSGCALVIDYILTITISVASGSDAIFSFIPIQFHNLKVLVAIAGIVILILLNLRGAKESVIPLVPLFLIFLGTHVFAILYGIISHLFYAPTIIHSTVQDIHGSIAETGLWGTGFLVLRAYTMGAGTYTGIEAVSNGISALREPRVRTGKRTMLYMALSLSFMVVGLMVMYLFLNVSHVPGKTLNAVMFESLTAQWGDWGHIFVLVALGSEALLLFVAAQAGFLDGPRVLANMAIDRWFPSRFATLSDRLVTQNGVFLMGITAIAVLILTGGSVRFLVVLYSINVFITFTLSQLGMVRHWWANKKLSFQWFFKFSVNGVGFLLTTIILIAVVIIKFDEGGWLTVLFTGALAFVAILIKKHYLDTAKRLHRLNAHFKEVAQTEIISQSNPKEQPQFDPKTKTAILFVNGFNGLGLRSLNDVITLFGHEFRNFLFVEIGVLDASNFKGAERVQGVQSQITEDLERYIQYTKQLNCYAEGVFFLGTDVLNEAEKVIPIVLDRFPGAVVFCGQLVFSEETFWTRLLHNHTAFLIQQKFFRFGIPSVLLPIQV